VTLTSKKNPSSHTYTDRQTKGGQTDRQTKGGQTNRQTDRLIENKVEVKRDEKFRGKERGHRRS
jgi:hypothetical protein